MKHEYIISLPKVYDIMPDTMTLNSRDIAEIYNLKNTYAVNYALNKGYIVKPFDKARRGKMRCASNVWSLGDLRNELKKQEKTQ